MFSYSVWGGYEDLLVEVRIHRIIWQSQNLTESVGDVMRRYVWMSRLYND